MQNKKIIVPNNFKPRDYQLPILQAFDQGVRFFDLVMHRRAGKDKTCMAIVAKAMLKQKGAYYYILPEFNQGRRVIWDNIDNDGFETIRHIHPDLWENKNNQEMKLTLRNGSIFQVVGSSDVNKLVGTNPRGLVYSEWSLQDPLIKAYMDPIIKANGGFSLYNYTPRGNNHAKKFHELAQNDPKYFSATITVDDTKLFSKKELEEIKAEYIREQGDDGLYLQEFYCSFETPVQGAYYSNQLNLAELEGRIGKVAYNPELSVYTAWDLGASDTTCIWFYQIYGRDRINFIDYYETFGAGMEHFKDVLAAKNYRYATLNLPHDAANKIQGKERQVESRAETLMSYGYSINVVPQHRVMDGIQKVRSLFSKCWFDEEKCERGLDCLKEYKKAWSEKNQLWSDMPDHNWASHGADAFRYFATSYQEPYTTIISDNGTKVQLDPTQVDPNRYLNTTVEYESW